MTILKLNNKLIVVIIIKQIMVFQEFTNTKEQIGGYETLE